MRIGDLVSFVRAITTIEDGISIVAENHHSSANPDLVLSIEGRTHPLAVWIASDKGISKARAKRRDHLSAHGFQTVVWGPRDARVILTYLTADWSNV